MWSRAVGVPMWRPVGPRGRWRARWRGFITPAVKSGPPRGSISGPACRLAREMQVPMAGPHHADGGAEVVVLWRLRCGQWAVWEMEAPFAGLQHPVGCRRCGHWAAWEAKVPLVGLCVGSRVPLVGFCVESESSDGGAAQKRVRRARALGGTGG